MERLSEAEFSLARVSSPALPMNPACRASSFVVAVLLALPWGKGYSQSVDELMREGNAHDLKFEPVEALKCYLPIAEQVPDNADLVLRIARQYRHLAADTEDVDDKIKLGAMGLTYAERAVSLDPKDAETYLSVAISYVKMAPTLGNKEKMEASRQIKIFVDKAIEISPDKDLAWHILGCWHQRLADVGMVKRTLAVLVYGGLPEASNEESVKCLEKAIKLNPNRLIHYIELGRTYAQMGKDAEARQFIEKGLAMPNIGKDDADAKVRGRETLAELK